MIEKDLKELENNFLNHLGEYYGVKTYENKATKLKVFKRHFDKAVEMINKASECGADTIKFQTFKTEKFVSDYYKKKAIKKLKKFELTYDQFFKLSEISKRKKIKS